MSESLKDNLRNWLKGYSKLVILGIGNTLRGDDALGPEFIRRLRGRLPKNVKVIDGGVAPENFIGKIKRLKPSHVLLIDASCFSGKPGEMKIIPPDYALNVSISTHNLPLDLLATLISNGTGAKVMLLGIEPKNLNLGEEISAEVKESIILGSKMLLDVINSLQEKEHC